MFLGAHGLAEDPTRVYRRRTNVYKRLKVAREDVQALDDLIIQLLSWLMVKMSLSISSVRTMILSVNTQY